ncbi:PGF-CTERM sorting domain-containing protein [Natrarchaeobaculum aegyptiacum]|uniref:PGF-CTERM sorting domain-containing protein n=1 Tax=Natrarchaeobaculum aegyptiacum TaxID=745377 RepID=A0A2Z2HSW6_9EURY|nr:PGF-CTERM sorting domain-containing protein [Natrarchaeobaculum aegyptiacum]ARS90222.1 PGF-CTERM sorting domain-containing protein [Natrarchaeobaculum aegyptiacum]
MNATNRSGARTVLVLALVTVGLVVSVVAGPGVGAVAAQGEAVSEEAVEEPVPEEGDAMFEAEADDGSWISYINPRDAYRTPYLGEGSGKLCVTLFNEAGEPVTGESIPDTTVTIETGDELAWHDHADPFVVEYPLSTHYDQPLDADQFGTTDDLPQGDGYYDSHCLEWHGLDENETVEYGPVELEGEHADDVEVVGYIQQAHDSWDSDVDPLEAAQPYEDVGGWTYEPDASHGQVVAVLQLDGDVDPDAHGGGGADEGDAAETQEAGEGGPADDPDDPTPGLGPAAALLALATLAVATRVRRQ